MPPCSRIVPSYRTWRHGEETPHPGPCDRWPLRQVWAIDWGQGLLWTRVPVRPAQTRPRRLAKRPVGTVPSYELGDAPLEMYRRRYICRRAGRGSFHERRAGQQRAHPNSESRRAHAERREVGSPSGTRIMVQFAVGASYRSIARWEPKQRVQLLAVFGGPVNVRTQLRLLGQPYD